jgi:Integrator complex subunit 2
LKIALFVFCIPKSCISGSDLWLELKSELETKFKTSSGFSQSLTLSLFSNRIDNFHHAISELLNMYPILFTSEKYLMIKQLTVEVFPKSKIAELCIFLLKGQIISPITLDLFLFLMQAKVFDLGSSDTVELGIRDIIKKCKDLSPVLPNILQAALIGQFTKIPAEYIISIFESNQEITLQHVLLGYYVLYSFKILDKRSQYPQDLLNHINFWDLLIVAKSKYSIVYPELASIVAMLSPIHFDVTATLLGLEQAEKTYLAKLSTLDVSSPHELTLRKMINEKRSDYGIVREYLSTTKNGCESLLFCKYWKYFLYAKNPQKACMTAVSILSEPITAEVVINDPVRLLNALSPLLTQQYIEIYFLIINFASRIFKTDSNNVLEENKALKNSANLLFDSMLVQKLMVVAYNADPNVSVLVYRFIHQFFVDNPTVLRLIHFQGYSLDFVTSAVQHIPSLCNMDLIVDATIDFLPELLASHKRLPFGLAVGVALCKKYPVSRT